MTDILGLEIVTVPQEVAPDEYVPPYDEISNDPIDKGTYTVTFIDGQFNVDNKKKAVRFGTVTSKKDGNKYRSANFALEVQDAVLHGKTVGTRRFWSGRVNTIPEKLLFQQVKKGRENANSFSDMLRAAGYKGPLRSDDDYIDAILNLIEDRASARARIDKEAYCNPNSKEYAGCGHTIKGQDSFTIDGIRAKCPGDHTDATRPTLLASNVVKAFYPDKTKKADDGIPF